jgi:hypothetical protein
MNEPRTTDLTHLEDLDRVDRHRWSIACAYMFIKKMPAEAIIACASGGFDKFLAIARPVYEGHAFKYEDFQRIYKYIKREGERLAQVRLS